MEKESNSLLPSSGVATRRSRGRSQWPMALFSTLILISILSRAWPLTYALGQSCSKDRLMAAFSGRFNTSAKHRAHKLLEQNPLLDGHNDLAVVIRMKYNNHIEQDNFTEAFEKGGMFGNVDLPRMDEGRYGGAFMSAFWLCQDDIFDFSDAAYAPIVTQTLQQIDLVRRLSTRYPNHFPDTPTVAAARTNFKRSSHVAPIGIEGLHQIGNSFATLRSYYDLGVRYSTLNWNCHNVYTDAAVLTFFNNGSSVPAPPLHGGISSRGRLLIHEMNRIGMLVDLSHVSANTMRDALVGEHNPAYPLLQIGHAQDASSSWNGSLAPPIFSHSSVYALCPHPRNVPDDVLEMVKQRNSVVMINFNPEFISCYYPEGADQSKELPKLDKENATLEKVAQHIMYIGEKVGYAYVGIGSDFDGIETVPKGLEGVDKMPALVEELLKNRVDEKDVINVIGGNVLRVWREAELVAEKLQKLGMRPAEDAVPSLVPP